MSVPLRQRDASADPGPRPRPRRGPPGSALQHAGPQLTVDETLLLEANRRISVREGKQTVELTMLQAVVRTMGGNALRGRPAGPQLMFLRLVQAAEARQEATQQELFKCMLEYKAHWEETRAAGETPLRLLPLHPDDVKLDWATGQVRINGPSSEAEHAHWAMMRAKRDAAAEELAELREEMAQEDPAPGLRGVYEDEIAFSR